MVALSIATYIFIRLVSFLTYNFPINNQIIAAIIIIGFAYFCFKNIKLGLVLLMTELIIDGAGHFFELQGLLLRTWFLGIFVLAWFISKIKNKQVLFPNRSIQYGLIGLGFFVLYAAISGFYHEHATAVILQDAIVYFFLGLILPTLEWKKELEKPFISLMKAWIIGTTIFSTTTLFIYSSGLGYLPDNYYHWFRNVASGKITDLGHHFFRIVLPEHLLIVPIILILAALLIRDPKNKGLWALQFCSTFILALNFSRIYFLALAIGLLVLVIKQNLKQWFIISTITGVSVLLFFSATHLVASKGQSSGLELLGVRLGGSVAPTADVSGAIRLAILPDALRQIKERPFFGSGLGATVSYVDPATKLTVSRTQFDWGYLEMLAEFGIIGVLIFLLFVCIILKQTISRAYFSVEPKILERGLLAGAISLAIINITTPALFHGFGILYFILMITAVNRVSAQSPDEPARIS